MKQVIILTKEQKNGYFEVSYLFWLAVPVNQQSMRANSALSSTYLGASAAENTSIQLGQVVEQSGVVSYPNGTANAIITADLQAKYTAAQAAVNAESKWHYYGTNWDGTTWTLAGVN